MLLFITITFAFILSVICIPLLAGAAPALGLLDKPDNNHKRHTQLTPLVGGIGIFLGLSAAVLFIFYSDYHWIIHPAFLLGASLLLVAGLLDDIYQLGVAMRFAVQASAAAIMALWGGILLSDLGHLVSLSLVTLGVFALPMTLFATSGVINALNMVDGMDGLAGSLAIVTFACLAIIAGLGHQFDYMLFAVSIIAAVAGFLVYNLRLSGDRRASVFMGDAGSYVLGFAIAWLCIALAQGSDRAMTPVTALWIFAIPLIDTIVVMLRRKYLGGSPFTPDHTHLHHLLLRAGFRVPQIVIYVTGLQILFCTVGLIGLYQGVSEWVMFYILLTVLALHFYFTRQPQKTVAVLWQWRRSKRLRFDVRVKSKL